MEPLIVNRLGKLGLEEINDCPVITHLSQVLYHVAQRKAQRKSG
jgi:hypothetical protein